MRSNSQPVHPPLISYPIILRGPTYLPLLQLTLLRRLMKSLHAPRILIPRNIYTQPRHAFATAVVASVRPPLKPIPIIRTPCDRYYNSTLTSSHADVDSGIFLPPTNQGTLSFMYPSKNSCYTSPIAGSVDAHARVSEACPGWCTKIGRPPDPDNSETAISARRSRRVRSPATIRGLITRKPLFSPLLPPY